jgi:enamine deaminase RidA (YjgF/YER057c/UK114 family)
MQFSRLVSRWIDETRIGLDRGDVVQQQFPFWRTGRPHHHGRHHHGRAWPGWLFGPAMVVWFVVIGLPGAAGAGAELSLSGSADARADGSAGCGQDAADPAGRVVVAQMAIRAIRCHPVGAARAAEGPMRAAQSPGRAIMAIKVERCQPEGMNVRMSAGQPSYSHVVTVSGTGKLVFIAGQLARDIDGNCVGKGDMRAQMEQTFQNLDHCLRSAGASWADVVKTNTYVTDFDEFQKCADVRMRYFGVATPTSTTVGVTRLAGPDFMIEIEAVAVVNG